MKHTLFLFCFALLFACKQNNSLKTSFVPFEGGSDYPKHVVDSGFFFHPMNEKLSREDSFWFAWYETQVLQAFEEVNFGLGPGLSTEMRLKWEDGSLGSNRPVVIVVRENEIEVKEGINGFYYPYEDTSCLSENDRADFRLLESYYPLNSPKHKPFRRKYLDSIVDRSPELLNASYYMSLKRKALWKFGRFEYRTTKMPIKNGEYNLLLSLVNSSGFWSTPYFLHCPNFATDPGSFVFEVRAPQKYNMVWGLDCQGDTSAVRMLCQRIVELAGMEKKIKLIWR